MDTLAPFPLQVLAVRVGLATETAKSNKRRKHDSNTKEHIFLPFGVDIFSPRVSRAKGFLIQITAVLNFASDLRVISKLSSAN